MFKIYSLIAAFLVFGSVNAQILTSEQAKSINNNLSEVRFDQRTDAPLYMEFTSGSNITAADGINGLSSILRMKSGDSWQLIRNDKDNLGFTHSRYQQYYQNIKVITGEYILHEKGNRLVAANGVFITS